MKFLCYRTNPCPEIDKQTIDHLIDFHLMYVDCLLIAFKPEAKLFVNSIDIIRIYASNQTI